MPKKKTPKKASSASKSGPEVPNTFRLVFSKDEIKIANVLQPRKNIELSLLRDLILQASNTCKDLSSSISMVNLHEELEGFKGASLSIHITDMKTLIASFDSLSGQRPGGWFVYCKNLLRQLDNFKS